MQITFDNYFQCSAGNFTPCEMPIQAPDFSSRESQYWHLVENNVGYLIRRSNHWGQVLNCQWQLDHKGPKGKEMLCGVIKLSDLHFNYQGINRLKILLLKLPQEVMLKIFEDLTPIAARPEEQYPD